MKVTEIARSLPSEAKDSFRWRFATPSLIYSIPLLKGQPFGSPVAVGEKFHSSLERFWSGQHVEPWFYGACLGVMAGVEELGVDIATIRTEVAIRSNKTWGVIDFIGSSGDRSIVGEVKTTCGKFLRAPSPDEVCQASLYGALQGSEAPLLVFFRVCFRSSRVAVYLSDECKEYIDRAKEILAA
ncbi:hypothetical protein DDZ13_08180 [Coraliomargarita sinensis]|uniref:PD-(D/E)XK endonuclease-like domain-containing protein n=1 Tax=Coraliomargarita sinensis TaxID=2174842 RepID=A0A317ZIH2_9BACT|nr:hypothetical protein [Coraliomargarita sinensis]PXA04013.1 hypothetical protein DDZ13_08180 [Coraliomargarita sinensis]